MFFFSTFVYLHGNLRVRLATQRKSLRKFNLWLLATTWESVWPGLKEIIPSLSHFRRILGIKYETEKHIERFSGECHKTKTKPITYQLDYSANLKPTVVKPKPKYLSDYFRHSIENRSIFQIE